MGNRSTVYGNSIGASLVLSNCRLEHRVNRRVHSPGSSHLLIWDVCCRIDLYRSRPSHKVTIQHTLLLNYSTVQNSPLFMAKLMFNWSRRWCGPFSFGSSDDERSSSVTRLSNWAHVRRRKSCLYIMSPNHSGPAYSDAGCQPSHSAGLVRSGRGSFSLGSV